MKFGLILLSFLSFSSACNAGDFFNGLVAGLEVNPSSIGTCGTDLLNIASGIVGLVQDGADTLGQKTGAFSKFIEDSQALTTLLETFSSECKFTSFFEELSKFASKEGRKAMIKTYLNGNVAAIDNNMYNVWNCQKDYGVCGESLGFVIKTLTGATLNSSLRTVNSAISMSGIKDFVESFVMTYVSQTAHTPLCQGDMLKLMPGFHQFMNDMKNLELAADDMSMISVEYTVLTTCWETDWKNNYTLEDIKKFFKVLNDPKAWQLSYFMNTASMDIIFGQLENCSGNLFNCGAALPKLAKLVGAWVDYN